MILEILFNSSSLFLTNEKFFFKFTEEFRFIVKCFFYTGAFSLISVIVSLRLLEYIGVKHVKNSPMLREPRERDSVNRD